MPHDTDGLLAKIFSKETVLFQTLSPRTLLKPKQKSRHDLCVHGHLSVSFFLTGWCRGRGGAGQEGWWTLLLQEVLWFSEVRTKFWSQADVYNFSPLAVCPWASCLSIHKNCDLVYKIPFVIIARTGSEHIVGVHQMFISLWMEADLSHNSWYFMMPDRCIPVNGQIWNLSFFQRSLSEFNPEEILNYSENFCASPGTPVMLKWCRRRTALS